MRARLCLHLARPRGGLGGDWGQEDGLEGPASMDRKTHPQVLRHQGRVGGEVAAEQFGHAGRGQLDSVVKSPLAAVRWKTTHPQARSSVTITVRIS